MLMCCGVNESVVKALARQKVQFGQAANAVVLYSVSGSPVVATLQPLTLAFPKQSLRG